MFFFGVFSPKKTIIFGVCREAATFFGLFLELILEFFGAKRQFFLEVIFGVFFIVGPLVIQYYFIGITQNRTWNRIRNTLHGFFRRCAALLSQKVITNWCFPLVFSQLYCKLGTFFWRYFLEFFAAKRRYFLEVFFGVFSPRSGENLEVFFGGFFKKNTAGGARFINRSFWKLECITVGCYRAYRMRRCNYSKLVCPRDFLKFLKASKIRSAITLEQ